MSKIKYSAKYNIPPKSKIHLHKMSIMSNYNRKKNKQNVRGRNKIVQFSDLMKITNKIKLINNAKRP